VSTAKIERVMPGMGKIVLKIAWSAEFVGGFELPGRFLFGVSAGLSTGPACGQADVPFTGTQGDLSTGAQHPVDNPCQDATF
jgi:hypothetical protein